MEQKRQKGILVLEDGTAFEGISVGATGMTVGEVVFNTSMTGYQEVLTDPSYVGQIVAMTYPLIGNYGVNMEDNESAFPAVAGFVAREIAEIPSNWRSSGSLTGFLESRGVVALVGVDTRALTRHLRSRGTMRGVILAGEQAFDLQELARIARESPCVVDDDPVRLVTARELYTMGEHGLPVVLWDLGAKGNIARSLVQRGCRVTVVPAWTSAEAILAMKPAGIMLSNGPGDPKQASYVVSELGKLLPERIPTFGICLGHQILGLALGGETYKLKFGHRGGNHPVKDLNTGRVYITSQNHGYAVDVDTLDSSAVMVSHVNLNDGTVEGLQHRHLPVFSVQYHPEASPGPQDSDYLFDRFVGLIA